MVDDPGDPFPDRVGVAAVVALEVLYDIGAVEVHLGIGDPVAHLPAGAVGDGEGEVLAAAQPGIGVANHRSQVGFGREVVTAGDERRQRIPCVLQGVGDVVAGLQQAVAQEVVEPLPHDAVHLGV